MHEDDRAGMGVVILFLVLLWFLRALLGAADQSK